MNLGIILESRRKVYIYGFELLFSSIMGIGCLIILSVLGNKPLAWLPYLLGFIPLRITGGGFHAKTHFTCIASFSFVFLLFLILSDLLCLFPYVNLVFSCISLVMTCFLAPVEAVNKHLSVEVRQKNKKKSMGFSCFSVMVSLVALITQTGHSTYFAMYFAGVFSAGLSMLTVFQQTRSN